MASPDNSRPPIHTEAWFEWLLVVACLAAGISLSVMNGPIVVNQPDGPIQVALDFAHGHWTDGFTRMGGHGLYTLLMTVLIKMDQAAFGRFLSLPDAFALAFRTNIALYGLFVILVHFFARRELGKPHSLILTGLFSIIPLTLHATSSLDGGILFGFVSLLSVFIIENLFTTGISDDAITPLNKEQYMLCGVLLWACAMAHPYGIALSIAFLLISTLCNKAAINHAGKTVFWVLLALSPWLGIQLYYGSALHTMNHHLGFWAITEHFWHQQGTCLFGNYVNHWLEPYEYVWWTISSIVLLGVIRSMFKSAGIYGLYMMGYCLATLLWSDNDATLVSMVPLLLYTLYIGVITLGEWMNKIKIPVVEKYMSPAVTSVIIGAAVLGQVYHSGALSGNNSVGATLADSVSNAGDSASNMMAVASEKFNEAKSNLDPKKFNDIAPTDTDTPNSSENRSPVNWLERNVPAGAKISGLSQLPNAQDVDNYHALAASPKNYEKANYIVEQTNGGNSPEFRNWLSQTNRKVSLAYNDPWHKIQIWQAN